LRKALKGVAELVFTDAPHSAAGAFPESAAESCDAGAGPPPDPRGWWTAGELAEEAGGWVRPSVSRCAVGWPESLAVLRAAMAELGPFDGVLGFSQGAAAAALLLAAEPASFRCAILVSGFVAMDPALADALEGAGKLPHSVLSVSGQADALVAPERVARLAACFERSQLFEHAGGHGVPSSRAFRDTARSFLLEVQSIERLTDHHS